MTIAKVGAAPGRRMDVLFAPHGYLVQREDIASKVEHWLETCFSLKVLFISLGLALVSSLPGTILLRDDPSDAKILAVTAAPLLFLAYFLFGMLVRMAAEVVETIVEIVALFIPSRRRQRKFRKRPLEQRPGFVAATHIVQAWSTVESKRVTVVVRFADGSRKRFVGKAEDGHRLAAQFQQLLGPRLVPVAA
ncbi:hypothetical protein BAY61_16690 [Prauserella marina]|uniref:Uncharacterized protein n=1 Tax=Prauserella marina TaxID=530584 RepID=A0A222VRK0_9PSEU|nr:hypothetical protein [Prauserella marina]ASR36373.1 hypothetical protein BAY61_16690 [Prauserella marina]PWV77170.1 hypothetical protein DES30_105387 [Prauserella marina]SDD06010.1 hypothetical protein SAMN05421630_105388 [Prauserella marina]